MGGGYVRVGIPVEFCTQGSQEEGGREGIGGGWAASDFAPTHPPSPWCGGGEGTCPVPGTGQESGGVMASLFVSYVSRLGESEVVGGERKEGEGRWWWEPNYFIVLYLGSQAGFLLP